MRETGGKIRSTESQLSLVATAENILETMKTIRNVVMEYSNGQMAAATRAIGETISNTVVGSLSTKMEWEL